ncbi:unnamed protein product [Ambrosiozyma monospora]|uniref:Unnamed protein product n=1 Tax=Ambrosiozyma monospora TaxID=43982 RepID=A0ACB5SZP5_AMBMO|nr:unnamed protein product [Ambrosiozyma monospora]
MGNLMSTSFAPECTPLKQKYDGCFNEWYSEKFLKGKSTTNECEDLWYEYQECVRKHMTEQKLDKMLDDARKEAPFENGGALINPDDEKNKKK